MEKRKGLLCLQIVGILFFYMFCLLPGLSVAAERVSKPGEYSGYSEPIYKTYVRSSQYVPSFDETLLAVDIYRPSDDGITPTSDPWPAIVLSPPYPPDFRRTSFIPLYLGYVRFGYVVVVMDPRGLGASFGSKRGDFDLNSRLDGKAIIEWIADQPFCDGLVATMGLSYMGTTQFAYAITQPEPLVSIIPQVAAFDNYQQFYPNGVTAIPANLPGGGEILGYPVDDDTDGSMASAALLEHAANIGNDQILFPDLFRDSWNTALESRVFIDNSNITYCDEIETSNVAIYQLAAWFDHHTDEQLVAFKRLGHKILIGPWTHGFGDTAMTTVEHQRWFDYTLKGINNGILDEPPLYYYTTNAPEGKEWRFGPEWPLPNQKLVNYYLNDQTSGTVASVNDGGLAPSKSKKPHAKDEYTVDYSVTVFNGAYNRSYRSWPGDMTPSPDEKGLTYTTPPLKSDTEITGHPVIHLWVKSSVPDGYFFAYLEEVDSDGFSHYVSDGVMKASFRKIYTDSPWYDVGIPYHRGFEEDYAPLLNHPVEVAFEFFPISYVFRKGNRIRLTITCSDQISYPFPKDLMFDPPPQVSIYRDKMHPSHITLPLIPNKPTVFDGNAKIKTFNGYYEGPAELYTFKTAVYLHFNNQWINWETIKTSESHFVEHFKCRGELGHLSVLVKTHPNAPFNALATGQNVYFKGDAM